MGAGRSTGRCERTCTRQSDVQVEAPPFLPCLRPRAMDKLWSLPRAQLPRGRGGRPQTPCAQGLGPLLLRESLGVSPLISGPQASGSRVASRLARVEKQCSGDAAGLEDHGLRWTLQPRCPKHMRTPAPNSDPVQSACQPVGPRSRVLAEGTAEKASERASLGLTHKPAARAGNTPSVPPPGSLTRAACVGCERA